MTLINLKDLEAHLWHAAHIITGPIDASDYKTYIFPILFFKRICDVYDEEFEEALEQVGDEELAKGDMFHRIQIPANCHWKDVFAETKDIGQALKDSFRGIELENPQLHGIFGDASWTNKERLSDELLSTLLNHFNKVNLGVSSVRNDDMGRAYEYLIKRFADKANKKAGEFYTPRTIVRLMVNILDPQANESVYDPACGTGGMLLETIHHVKENGGDPRLLKIKGQEKNLTTEAIARMNLFLHGQEDFEIVRGDTLRDPKFLKNDQLESFDCVIANPPFSLKEWGHDYWTSDPYGRASFGLAPKTNGDFAWVQHMFASLNDKGRMAVVLPHGVLFRGGAEGKIRTKLLKENRIVAVIGVASNLFYGTGIPACILVLRKARPEEHKDHVLIVNAEELFTKGRAQNTLSEPQADEIYDIYQNMRTKGPNADDIEGVARWVPHSEIEENDFNLNIARYVQKPLEEETITVEEALKDFQQKLAALEAAEQELEALLIKEGFEL
ncbi:SAM-dependent DNA methyltransferase [Vibrio parahaemolyticus]|uniref:type I restriction-modification system subunit M n=1 Tax=Photobacterium sp. GSS17 TaxID=3020715 RepID=UPI0010D8EC3D|nr:class I SAM-dependent DNA methyltransferase [Photobacterium sp. GSS17]TBT12454.1 SAM-dependent DNA methyltransferase [Vibrio parahaemolyticus]HBC0006780.1 SAM-dependent DNA methyltransferase [Vibrio parahaemolyticus]HBC0008455.1 SAM-dependent DNA methyltransferase [Vibrio parahaemolyticus]HBN6189719.1 SAM-dependent DNA methyltransferase [Vibrio parahaemolyticus]HBN6190943.1 SAM-dependent DNA methyltransferase [Vibrio parahaemolyticus]